MLHTLVLFVHIAAALATGALGIYALVDVGAPPGRIAARMRHLAWAAAFVVSTGTVLALISLSVHAPALCGSIALYVSFIMAAEIVLVVRARAARPAVALAPAVAPVLASLSAIVLVMGAGF